MALTRAWQVEAIYRAANLLIERHGTDAVVEAGRLLDLMLDRGDMVGRQVWLRIRRANPAAASGAGRFQPLVATVVRSLPSGR